MRGVLLVLLFAAASPVPASRAQDAQRLRITTASGVRVRARPDTGAGETAKLPLGVVLSELEHSQDKAKVGGSEDYWYLVSTPDGAKTWSDLSKYGDPGYTGCSRASCCSWSASSRATSATASRRCRWKVLWLTL